MYTSGVYYLGVLLDSKDHRYFEWMDHHKQNAIYHLYSWNFYKCVCYISSYCICKLNSGFANSLLEMSVTNEARGKITKIWVKSQKCEKHQQKYGGGG